MIKTRKQSLIVIGAIVLVLALFTTTYAFFNYTRTGSSNTIKTGRISFNHTQGQSINLTNMFPIEANAANLADPTKVGSVTINVTGDTTYSDGIEYLVSAVNVSNSVQNSEKKLPISIEVKVEDNDNNDPVTDLGEESNDYFNDRGNNSSYYSIVAGETIYADKDLLRGYIAPGSDGVDGNIVIKSYIDQTKVLISDTYPAEVTDTNSDEYLDGTPSSFGEGKTVFTTTEWNSLQTNGVSFQVKVEAREGTWLEAPRTAADTIGAIQTLVITPYGKVYSGANVDNYVWFNNEYWRIIGVYGDNLKIIKAMPLTTSQSYRNESYSWNSWSGSKIQAYLYNTYWPTLSETARGMIEENAIWDVGFYSDWDYHALVHYNSEILTQWTGKIGLISTYEYLYAGESNCWEGTQWNECYQTDWLFTAVVSDNGFNDGWTLSGYYEGEYDENANETHYAEIWGICDDGLVLEDVRLSNDVTPVVYLKSDINITGGEGTEDNPYSLG